MGRQLQLAMRVEDERNLLRFVSSLARIRVMRMFARTKDELFIDDWEESELPLDVYVWPEGFPWAHRFAQTGGPKCRREDRGFYYVSNLNTAPVLEIRRGSPPDAHLGRIYWARDFAAPHGLEYDDQAFSKLVDAVWRWIRRAGRRSEKRGPWFLPEAWEHYARSDGWNWRV